VKILALIPARGGSKRLPGKNIRILQEKPLIVWSIEVAKGIPEICDILVSTNDPAILTVCKEAGALVPWLRPASLATDEASSIDVAIHALDWYESEKGAIDGVMLLQPTSPFRSKQTVCKGIALFKKNKQHSVVGISPCNDHPMWALKMENNCLVPFMSESALMKRSQDLPVAYVVNGSFYLSSPEMLRANRTFIERGATPLIIESLKESLDIDTEWDFTLAESISLIVDSSTKYK
jgi:N-acylneuraminate cytidylyltransferase